MVNEMCSLALMLRDRVVILFFTTKSHAMFKLSLAIISAIMVSGKKRTPHGPADPDGSQKMFHIFNYNNQMCYYLRLFR